ncbi:hypothetical protein [Paenibacillus ihumii]|uniref:hypothetical protein n=1 Tax=Paenibacillus ihumii TaxID=687436 RepID=UPI000B07D040|nr:hypothetical protein [Paenibacillus ihumii]
MDEKTLQYLGERVDKAREIVKKIGVLKDFIKRSEGKCTIEINGDGRGSVRIHSYDFRRLAANAKVAVLNQVEEEIKLLEQELDEL